MKVIEHDRKRKERECQFSSVGTGKRLTVILFWKSESDRFGISSAARERDYLVSKVTLLQS